MIEIDSLGGSCAEADIMCSLLLQRFFMHLFISVFTPPSSFRLMADDGFRRLAGIRTLAYVRSASLSAGYQIACAADKILIVP